MKTTVMTSQKGGSGKTTLVELLSVEAGRAGDGPAWIIDTDPQGTLSQWHERREQDTPQRAELPFDRIAQGLEAMARRGAAYCFIDTAPTICAQSAALIHIADLILIPIRHRLPTSGRAPRLSLSSKTQTSLFCSSSPRRSIRRSSPLRPSPPCPSTGASPKPSSPTGCYTQAP